MQIKKLVIRKRVEGLNKLFNLHRMRRYKMTKAWHKAIASAPCSLVTVDDGWTETISTAVARLSQTLSVLADT